MDTIVPFWYTGAFLDVKVFLGQSINVSIYKADKFRLGGIKVTDMDSLVPTNNDYLLNLVIIVPEGNIKESTYSDMLL